KPAQYSHYKRNPQINGNTFCYCRYGNIHNGPFKPKIGRKYGNKKPSVKTIGKNLKNTIQRNQTSTVFTAAIGQVVPNQNHGDATRQANQNKSDHIFWIIA